MTEDARFEDGREAPVNLGALTGEDLQIVSALVQDAVLQTGDMRWVRARRQFAMLVNRFRWEDPGRTRHQPERVRSLLVFEHVLSVASQGVDRQDGDLILSVLSLEFQPGEDGAGEVHVTLAGDGAIRLQVEALEARLRDVTRPHVAPSGKAPHHEL